MLIYFFIFILGLAVGSFLNCVIYRLEKGESFLKGRSYCPDCSHRLAWFDLMPVLSFLLLRGRCRYCRKQISIQYPLVEIATGLLFLAIFITFNWPIAIFYFLISIFLVIIFVYDLKHYIIPDKVIYPAIIITAVFNFNNWPSALGATGFFLAIVGLSQGKWLGIGDVKLAFLMGLLLGFPVILAALFLAFMAGAVMGMGLIFSGQKTLKSAVPFGPFLIGGTLAALFRGEQLINWYLNLL